MTTAAGSDSETKTGYITVGTAPSPPVASFLANITSGTEPLTVQFNDTSTNTPTSWRWAYKNATVGWTQFATTRNTSYTFSGGTHDINLTATNAAGSDDEIKPEYIEVTGGTSDKIQLTIIGSIDEWNLGLGQNEDVTNIDLGVTTTASSCD